MDLIFKTLINVTEIGFIILFMTLLGNSVNNFFFNKKNTFISFVEINSLALVIFFIFISIWNLFFPINIYLFLFFLVPISAEFFITLKKLNWIKNKYENKNILLCFSVFIFLIWVGNLSLGSLKYEPFYYVQKIRWSQQFSIIPGLGNLFDHYGIDNSLFLQIAFFDNIPFLKYSFWNFTGYILVIGFVYYLILPLYDIIYCDKKSSSFVSLLFFPAFINNCFIMYPGIYTDLPVFIFGSIMGIESFKIIIEEKKDYSQLLLSMFLAFSAKISILPYFSFSLLIFLFHKKSNILSYVNKNRSLSILITLAFSLQVYRNILLTGFFIYPVDKIPLPVKWKVEKNNADKISNLFFSKGLIGILYDIKNNNDRTSISNKIDWLKGRFLLSHKRIDTLYPIILGFFGLCINLLQGKFLLIKRLILYSIPAFAQILNFILLAPETRFVSFATWCFASGMIAIPLNNFLSLSRKYFYIFLLLLFSFSFSIHKVDFLGKEKNFIVKNISHKIPGIPKYTIYKTKSGLELNVPLNGQKCDDCPLPCTMTPNKKLSLIYGGLIKSGFFISD